MDSSSRSQVRSEEQVCESETRTESEYHFRGRRGPTICPRISSGMVSKDGVGIGMQAMAEGVGCDAVNDAIVASSTLFVLQTAVWR
jgi:hypothetical protein